ncbi:MAG: OsmC family protein [Planctomycetota bacterium]
MSRDTVVRLARPDASRVEIDAGPHHLVGDEGPSLGGVDAGPAPYEYLCTALGCCTTITLQMYAKRKQWPLEGVTVTVRHAKVNNDDTMEREVKLAGKLDDEQRARLLDVANKCPVHKTLSPAIKVTTRLT